MRGKDRVTARSFCTAEATPVILDRALCLLYLEEQFSGGLCTDTQAGQFWRPRGFHPAVYMVSAQLTRSSRSYFPISGRTMQRVTSCYHHVTAVPECEYIDPTPKDIGRTSWEFHDSTVSQHDSLSLSSLD